MKKRNLLVLATAFILACSKAHQHENALKTNVVSNIARCVVERDARSRELSAHDTQSTTAVFAAVDVARIEELVHQYSEQYRKGTGLHPSTRTTIEMARALRTNTTLSVNEKLHLIHKQPESMASKGAELCLLQHEYARSNLSLKEKVQLLECMAGIYDLFFHAEECIATVETALQLVSAADMRREMAIEYENLGSCYTELVDDPHKALYYYSKALEIGKDVKDVEAFNRDTLLWRVLYLHISLGQRSEAKLLFDANGCAGNKEFEGVERCLAHPNSKVNPCKNTLTIEGDVGEIPGLAEMKRNLTKTTQPQVRKYLYQVLATQLSIEEQNHL